MSIQKVAIIGAGTMGHGIAKICASAGQTVNLFSIDQKSLNIGYQGIVDTLKKSVSEGIITSEDADKTLSRITCTTDLKTAVQDVELVVEAVVEILKIKQDLFKELDSICDPNVILATNTSGLSPTAIAETSLHKERMVATHFWCPPELIPLVEIIPNDSTKVEVIDKTSEWLKSIGKFPVKMKKECLGFIGNRMQYALLREALHIYEQGWAELDEIDKAVEYSFGRRYPVTGPFRSADLGGVDIFYNASSYLFADLCKADAPQESFKKIFEANKFGLKTFEGFYKWDEASAIEIQEKRKDVLNYFLDRDEKSKI